MAEIETNIDFLQYFAAAGLSCLSSRVCAVSTKNIATVFGHCRPTKPRLRGWVPRQESGMPLSCSSLYFQLNAAQYLAISAPPHGAHYLYPQPSPASPAQPAQLSPAWCVADLYQLSPVPSPTLPGAGTWLHAGTSVGAVCSGSLLFLLCTISPTRAEGCRIQCS